MFLMEGQTLEVKLDVVPSGGELTVTVDYLEGVLDTDAGVNAINPGSQLSLTTNTTPKTVLAAPASGKARTLRKFSCPNTSSGSVLVTVQRRVSSTAYPDTPVLLASGSILKYEDGYRWYVVDKDGVELGGGGGSSGGPSTPAVEYIDTFGDGDSVSFLLAHGMATKDLLYAIQEVATPFDYAQVRIRVVDADHVLIDAFPAAPSADELRVILKKAAFAQSFGDGTSSSFVINHGLGSIDLVAAIWETGGLFENANADIELTDANNITISGFITPPALNELRVVLSKGLYSQSFGNGSLTSFPIMHSFGTKAVVYSLWDVTAGTNFSADAAATDNDDTTFSGFLTAPTLNQYRAVLLK